MMEHRHTLSHIPGKKHYIAIMSTRENDNLAIDSYHIVATSYNQAQNVARNILFDSSHNVLEGIIEINIKAAKEDAIFDFGIGEEKGDKGEPGITPVNSMTYWNGAKKKDEFKFCPFRFDNNGGMRRCVGHTCMAYIVDPAVCSPYCARLRKEEKR